jgi:hypothetical protein
MLGSYQHQRLTEPGSCLFPSVPPSPNVYRGSVIRIVSTVLAVGRRFANLEIKITDSASGKLFVTGAQAKADVVRSKMSLDPLRLDESGSEGYVERVSSEFKAKQHSSWAKL